jgi:hypothetical protein
MHVRLVASTILLCACGSSGSGSPPPDGADGVSDCTVTVAGDLAGSNLACSKSFSPFVSGTQQAQISVAATPTQPLTMSMQCIEPTPLAPGTYGLQSPTTHLGCSAVLDEVRTADGAAGSGYDFLPRPSAGATIEATLTSVTPLHGRAKGTLVEYYFDGGAGRTVTFTATF